MVKNYVTIAIWFSTTTVVCPTAVENIGGSTPLSQYMRALSQFMWKHVGGFQEKGKYL